MAQSLAAIASRNENAVVLGYDRTTPVVCELTQAELREFSCYCGGHVSTEQMAQPIEHLANRC